MVKHIVMWRLKEQAHGNDRVANARHIKERLESLAGRIDGLLAIEVGIDFSASADAADLVLYSVFRDREALAAYHAHPLHQAVIPLVAETRSERRVVDYET